MLTRYMPDETFRWLLEDLNYEDCAMAKQRDIVRRAVSQMESELSSKFVVPLVDRKTGQYKDAPAHAQGQVESCLKAKIRAIIGQDKNRNLGGTAQTTKPFQDANEADYQSIMKSLLNFEIDYGFLLQNQAQGGKEPVQQLGIARSDISREGGGKPRGRY